MLLLRLVGRCWFFVVVGSLLVRCWFVAVVAVVVVVAAVAGAVAVAVAVAVGVVAAVVAAVAIVVVVAAAAAAAAAARVFLYFAVCVCAGVAACCYINIDVSGVVLYGLDIFAMLMLCFIPLKSPPRWLSSRQKNPRSRVLRRPPRVTVTGLGE